MRKVYSFLQTKSFALLIITCILTTVSSHVNAQANAGIWDSYLRLGNNDYYLGYSSTPPPVFTTNQRNAPALNGVNLGSFDPTATLILQGALFYGWKPTICCTGNICSAYLLYAIYPVGSSNPSFTSQQINNNGSQGNKGTYFWQEYFDTTLSINILAGLAPGKYVLDIWASSTGSETGNDCNSSISTNGLPSDTAKGDYTATFTIKGLVCPAPPASGTELITNGNFDAGNTGFTSGYNYVSAFTGNSDPPEYVVGTAAQMKEWNTAFVISGDASGNANGNFMGVDGAAGLNVWSETVKVTPNTVYIFSFYSCGFNGTSPAQLYFYANNTAFGGSVNTPTANKWSKSTETWCSGSDTTVTISIEDTNPAMLGNDFGLDSISLRSSTSYSNVTASGGTSICSGNSAQLGATPGACTYLWSPSTGLDHDSIAAPVATPTITTTYTLYAVVPGCVNVTDSSNVVIAVTNSSGILNITASPDSICIGGNSTLSITSGSGSYAWSSTGGLSTTSGASIAVSPTVTTSYTVVTAGGGSCSSTGNFILKVSNGTGGVLSVTASPDSICIGQNSILSVSGGFGAYQWSPSSSLNSSTGASVTASPVITTTYTVTDGGGACASTGLVTIKVSSSSGSTLAVTANPDTIHCGDNSVLSVTAGSGNYLWTPTGGATTTSGSPLTVNPTATTVYTVKAPGGACAATGSVKLTITPIAGGTVSAIRDTICQNSPGNLSLAGNSSNTIQWQSSGNDITYTTVSGATSSTYKTNPLQQSTWYHALVGTGACTVKSDSLLLYVPPTLTASFYSTYIGSNELSFNSDSSSGHILSYHWSFGDGQTSDVQNPTHTFAKDSTYYVCLTLYDGSNCSYTYCRYSSPAEAIPTVSAVGNWVVYPNPFSEQLTVSSKQLKAGTKILSIEMYDVLGQEVVNKNLGNEINNSIQLDVSSLAKGMYFVMIRTTTTNYIQKVVKQ